MVTEAMVITAHVGDDALEAARREGLLAVLSKPVDVPRLLELLASARRDGLVAVIEDDLRLSDNLCEALRSRGYAAVTASSVTETERLGPVRPFCALVDLRLPGGPDGEALRRLGAKYPGLPMIVVTAYHDLGFLRMCEDHALCEAGNMPRINWLFLILALSGVGGGAATAG